jgi:hypothetical protein
LNFLVLFLSREKVQKKTHGSENAIIYPAGFSLLPPTESATYCLTLVIYVHGVDEPAAGRVVSHNSLPVVLLKAKNFLS